LAKAYQPVPGHVLERLQIAVLCQEQMDLHWEDEASGLSYYQRVQLLGLEQIEDADYLLASPLSTGEPIRVRLDFIRNLPTPLK